MLENVEIILDCEILSLFLCSAWIVFAILLFCIMNFIFCLNAIIVVN